MWDPKLGNTYDTYCILCSKLHRGHLISPQKHYSLFCKGSNWDFIKQHNSRPKSARPLRVWRDWISTCLFLGPRVVTAFYGNLVPLRNEYVVTPKFKTFLNARACPRPTCETHHLSLGHRTTSLAQPTSSLPEGFLLLWNHWLIPSILVLALLPTSVWFL